MEAMEKTSPSAAQASLTGIAFMAIGAWFVFVGTGAPRIAPAKDIPLWMVTLFGAAFIFAGAAMFLRYRFLGGMPSDVDSGVAGPLASPCPLALLQERPHILIAL